MYPICAIVGRPNTGKSTLFNRLVRKRLAITSEIAGTTRDRIFALADFHERQIMLVDTGGLDFGYDLESMEDNIIKQSATAIAEADIIIFLVDGTEDLTSDDYKACEMIRKSQKPVLLVANKADRGRIDNNLHIFYELGLGEPVKVSGILNIGIDNLKTKVIETLADSDFEFVSQDDQYESDRIKVSFLGKPNVGKSSLLNCIFEDDKVMVSDTPGTTRDSISLPFELNDNKYLLTDTAGIRRSGKLRFDKLEKYSVMRSLQSLDSSDIGLLVMDATEKLSKQDMRVAEFISEAKKGVIIVLNKADLISPEEKNAKVNEIHYKMPFLHYAPLIFTSAQTGTNVMQLFPLLDDIFKERNKEINTRELNYYIDVSLDKHQPRPGLKFKLVKQVATNPPTFVFFVNDTTLIHFSYKRYLENKIREKYGFTGTALDINFKDSKANPAKFKTLTRGKSGMFAPKRMKRKPKK